MEKKSKGKGRQKIDIKRIQHEDYRKVTFSKRRNGLFNKATELCILCGAEVALMVFSPAGKVYSFAHPSVHSVINRYVYGVEDSAIVQNNFVREHKLQLTQVTEELATEKKKAEILNGLTTDQVPELWWEKPIDEHDVAELRELMVAMEEFQKKLMKRADDLMSMEASSSSPSQSFSAINPASRMSEAAPYHGFQMDFVSSDFTGNMSSSFDNFESSSWSSFEE